MPAPQEPKVPLPAKLAVGGIAGVIGTTVILCVHAGADAADAAPA
jgi:hypothetical protein